MADRLPRVYLAGKIGKHDWRHTLFPLRHVELSYDERYDRISLNQQPLTRDGFEYCGPYFLGDDHGCFHGRNQHGLIDPGWADGHSMDDQDFPQVLKRQTVMRSCLHWIDQADAVFCWLDALDAYGTLAELGYARARDIPIYLAPDAEIRGKEPVAGLPEPPEDRTFSALEDFWFVTAMADEVESDYDVAYAWKDFVAWWEKRGWSPPPAKVTPLYHLLRNWPGRN